MVQALRLFSEPSSKNPIAWMMKYPKCILRQKRHDLNPCTNTHSQTGRKLNVSMHAVAIRARLGSIIVVDMSKYRVGGPKLLQL